MSGWSSMSSVKLSTLGYIQYSRWRIRRNWHRSRSLFRFDFFFRGKHTKKSQEVTLSMSGITFIHGFWRFFVKNKKKSKDFFENKKNSRTSFVPKIYQSLSIRGRQRKTHLLESSNRGLHWRHTRLVNHI